MNRIEVNYRVANVDRFCEIMFTCSTFGWYPKFVLLNAPAGYRFFFDILSRLDVKHDRINCLGNESVREAAFICEYPPNIRLTQLMLHTCEPLEDITERIRKSSPIEKPQLDNAAFALLDNYIQKMQVTSRDTIQDLLDLSCVIAAMDGELVVRGHHLAEACQYCCKSLDFSQPG